MTRELAFIEAPCGLVVERFVAWQQRIGRRRGIEPAIQNPVGDLESMLTQLLPLTSLEHRRYLFVPTASTWTAYFDNGHRGSDPGPPLSFLAEGLKACWLRVVVDLPTSGLIDEAAQRGDLILEFHGSQARFGPDPTDKRILDLTVGESGRWQFRQIGLPLPFERVDRYTARRIADRFDFDLLREYLAALGILAFDAEFYAPEGTAYLVEKIGPRLSNDRDWSLEEAQQFWRQAGVWTAARTV